MWKLGCLLGVGLAAGLACVPANAELVNLGGSIVDDRPTLIYFVETGEVMVDPGVIPGLGYRRLLKFDIWQQRDQPWDFRFSPSDGNDIIRLMEDGGNPQYRPPGGVNPGYYPISGPIYKIHDAVFLVDDYQADTGQGNFFAGLDLADPWITFHGDLADLILVMLGGDLEVARAHPLWPGEFFGQRPILAFGPLMPAGLAEDAIVGTGIGTDVIADGTFGHSSRGEYFDIEEIIYVDDTGGAWVGGAETLYVPDFMAYLDTTVDRIGLAPPENVPEPSTFVLLAMGAMGLWWASRRTMWKPGCLLGIGLAVGLTCVPANAEFIGSGGSIVDDRPTLIYFVGSGEVMIDPGVLPGLGYRRLFMFGFDGRVAPWDLRFGMGDGNKIIPFMEDGDNPKYRPPGGVNPGYYRISGPNLRGGNTIILLDDYNRDTGRGNFLAGLDLADPWITFDGDMADIVLQYFSGGDLEVARAHPFWPGEFFGQRPILTFGPLMPAGLAEDAIVGIGIGADVNADGRFNGEQIEEVIYVDDTGGAWVGGGERLYVPDFMAYLDTTVDRIGLAPPENVPEPSTFVLLAIGAAGLWCAKRGQN